MSLFTFRVRRAEMVEREFHIESCCEVCARQLISQVDITFRKAGGAIPTENVYGKVLDIVDIDFQPSQAETEVELITEGERDNQDIDRPLTDREIE